MRWPKRTRPFGGTDLAMKGARTFIGWFLAASVAQLAPAAPPSDLFEPALKRWLGDQPGGVAAAYIDNPGQTREVISLQYCWNVEIADARHSGVEYLSLCRMAREIVEKRLAVHLFEGRRSRLHCLVEMPPRPPEERLAVHERQGANRLRMIRSQQLAA